MVGNLLLLALIFCSAVSGELVYICGDSLGNPLQHMNEAEYQSCGASCQCKAFEAICIFTDPETGEFVSIERASLETTFNCDDCLCNTNGESEWKQRAEQILGQPAPWVKPVPVPGYDAARDITSLGDEYP